MLNPQKVTTPYSSYHVSYLPPKGLGIAWRARTISSREMAEDLRAIADEIERLEAEAMNGLSPETRGLAEKQGTREAIKMAEKQRLADERDFFARGGLKDEDGNIIQEPT